MIAVVLLIVGVSFTQMTRHTIEESNYDQLFSYADSVVESVQNYANEYTPGDDPEVVLEQSFALNWSWIYTHQNINFVYINDQKEVIYPMDVSQQTLINEGLMESITKVSGRLWSKDSIKGHPLRRIFMVKRNYGLCDATKIKRPLWRIGLTQPAVNLEKVFNP